MTNRLVPPLPCRVCGQVPEFFCEGQTTMLQCERLSCDNVQQFKGRDPGEVVTRWNAANAVPAEVQWVLL